MDKLEVILVLGVQSYFNAFNDATNETWNILITKKHYFNGNKYIFC